MTAGDLPELPPSRPDPAELLAAYLGYHVLQEYARHAGQLDVVRELADGSTGE
jgi:Protein of unknown function (DUF664)